MPFRSVRTITKAEAEEIFVENYFVPVGFDLLPSGLDYTMADYSINSGPSRAVKDLQREIGVYADGIFGQKTLAALNDAIEQRPIEDLIVGVNNRRFAFMQSLPHWKHFKNGWTVRVMGNVKGAQSGDIGVIDRSVMLAQEFDNIPAPRRASIAKAPEPAQSETVSGDTGAVGTVISGGGVLTAAGGVLASLGDLHPIAQAVAIGGLLLALCAAVYVLRDRLRKIAGGISRWKT